jgi:rare lipoprotein A
MKALRISLAIPICIALACVVTSCGTKKKVTIAKPARIGSSETGIASWYGDPYHGRRAANGEIYDMEKLTAAHRTLPFDTWVRVQNLTNGKTVDVRIQDRGPFVNHRIIDLSRAAAREIELIGPGTAKVRLTVIASSKVHAAAVPRVDVPVARPAPRATAPPPLAPTAVPVAITEAELFAVQIGSFQDRGKAESLAADMREKYGTARVVVRDGKPALYRVLVGEENSNEKATALADRMRPDGVNGFVVRIDIPGPVE